MKKIVGVLLSVTFSIVAQASVTETICSSKNYRVTLRHSGSKVIEANYGIKGEINDGAEVSTDQYFNSSNVIAISLNVDYQPEVFQVWAAKENNRAFRGFILMKGQSKEPAVCIQKSAKGS